MGKGITDLYDLGDAIESVNPEQWFNSQAGYNLHRKAEAYRVERIRQMAAGTPNQIPEGQSAEWTQPAMPHD